MFTLYLWYVDKTSVMYRPENMRFQKKVFAEIWSQKSRSLLCLLYVHPQKRARVSLGPHKHLQRHLLLAAKENDICQFQKCSRSRHPLRPASHLLVDCRHILTCGAMQNNALTGQIRQIRLPFHQLPEAKRSNAMDRNDSIHAHPVFPCLPNIELAFTASSLHTRALQWLRARKGHEV